MRFRFSFDWMVCYEEDDGLFGGGKENLYGIGFFLLLPVPYSPQPYSPQPYFYLLIK